MKYLPDIDTFRELARDHSFVPVYRRLASDVLTPVSAFRRIDSEQGACLFESVIGGEKVGRYSFLASNPYMTFTAYGDQVEICQADKAVEKITSDNPLATLRQLLTESTVADLDDLPPFVSGAVGYAAYDVVRYAESLPNAPEDDRALPDLAFGFYDRMIIFDNVNKTIVVVVMARTDDSQSDSDAAYEQAQRQVDELVEQLTDPSESLTLAEIDLTDRREVALPIQSNFQQSEFEDAVRKCVEYIRAGDIFQVVISQRLQVPLEAPPFEVYRTLRMVNPSPFMFFLRTPDTTLVGSSPEIMCRVVGNEVTVRPLAGTRKRGATAEEDDSLAAELLADPKERAEHVMLVDLGRNDVGRVARFGTVELTDVMTIERYSHVMHITSNVNGELQEGFDAFDALQACLPAGTVSGAPKVRAMEIIDELEPHRRGPYAGAVGYFDFNGNMDTCIALRTMVIKDDTVYVQAGAGIVADSDPTSEYQETMNKARGLLKAIELTNHRCK
ncbi:MAG: anthranilate synthase component I [Planctomycetota bacterium]